MIIFVTDNCINTVTKSQEKLHKNGFFCYINLLLCLFTGKAYKWKFFINASRIGLSGLNFIIVYLLFQVTNVVFNL